jgi:RecG-like helicase
MKTWKKMLAAVVLIALAAAAYGSYLYNKKPADVRKLPADYEMAAAALVSDFSKDEIAANHKYLDKVIAVKGKITEVKLDNATGQATVTLDTGDPLAAVTCSFYNEEASAVKKLQQGMEAVVKGKCTGKLMDVVLNKCSIEQ